MTADDWTAGIIAGHSIDFTDQDIIEALTARAWGHDFNPPDAHHIAQHFLPTVRDLITKVLDEVMFQEGCEQYEYEARMTMDDD